MDFESRGERDDSFRVSGDQVSWQAKAKARELNGRDSRVALLQSTSHLASREVRVLTPQIWPQPLLRSARAQELQLELAEAGLPKPDGRRVGRRPAPGRRHAPALVKIT